MKYMIFNFFWLQNFKVLKFEVFEKLIVLSQFFLMLPSMPKGEIFGNLAKVVCLGLSFMTISCSIEVTKVMIYQNDFE